MERLRSTCIGGILLATVACPGEPVQRGQQANVEAPDSPLAAADALDDSGSGDTIPRASPVDSAAAAMRAGPEAVVELIVRWDTAGRILCNWCDAEVNSAFQSMLCYNPDIDCESAPAWGAIPIVDSYEIRPLRLTPDSALILVEYNVLAVYTNDYQVISKDTTSRWYAQLIRLSDQWRVTINGDSTFFDPHPTRTAFERVMKIEVPR